MILDPRNGSVSATKVFANQHLLNEAHRDRDAERRALAYLDRHAPDLVPMILGGVL